MSVLVFRKTGWPSAFCRQNIGTVKLYPQRSLPKQKLFFINKKLPYLEKALKRLHSVVHISGFSCYFRFVSLPKGVHFEVVEKGHAQVS